MSLLLSMDGISFTSRVLLSWTALSGTMGAGAGAQMEPLEEEMEVELSLKEEDERTYSSLK